MFSPSPNAKAAIVVLAAIVLAALVWLHTPLLNGPWYWLWRWRDPAPPTLRWYLVMGVAALPALLSVALSRRTGLILAMLMLSTFAGRFASVVIVRDTFDTSFLYDIVRSPQVTSYFYDAALLIQRPNWLADYPELLYWTTLHTQTKPPGPVIYWMTFIAIFGHNVTAAIAGAVGIGVLAAAGVPATYLLVRRLTDQPRAALLASAWLALAPGFVLFFPLFDAAYILFSCAAVLLWHGAVKADRASHAIAFGLLMAVATLWTYLILILCPLLFLVGLLCTGSSANRAFAVSMKQAGIALGAFIAAYAVFGVMTGFNPVATFAKAWENQQLFLQRHAAERVYPRTIPYDLLDFLLGAGWISAIVVVMLLMGFRRREWNWILVCLCVAQPIFVALTGMVQTETARVWMFMLPMWLIPVGLEIQRWPRWGIVAALAGLWLLTCVIGQHMTLLSPETV